MQQDIPAETSAYSASTRVEEPEPAEAAISGPPAANPAVIGLPSFMVGSMALGLVLVGMVPATAATST